MTAPVEEPRDREEDDEADVEGQGQSSRLPALRRNRVTTEAPSAARSTEALSSETTYNLNSEQREPPTTPIFA